MAKKSTQNIHIEYMPISEMLSAKRNPKRHNIAAITSAIERHGYVRPMLINEKTGRLVAGHGRLDALQRLKEEGGKPPDRILVKGGEWMVPVVRGVSFRTAKEAEAYLLADNRIGELGGYDDTTLQAMLAEIDKLDGTGFDEGFFEDLTYKLEGGGHESDGGGFDGFADAQLKQLICLYQSEEYDDVATRLEAVADAEGLETNTDVLLHLLDAHAAG